MKIREDKHNQAIKLIEISGRKTDLHDIKGGGEQKWTRCQQRGRKKGSGNNLQVLSPKEQSLKTSETKVQHEAKGQTLSHKPSTLSSLFSPKMWSFLSGHNTHKRAKTTQPHQKFSFFHFQKDFSKYGTTRIYNSPRNFSFFTLAH